MQAARHGIIAAFLFSAAACSGVDSATTGPNSPSLEVAAATKYAASAVATVQVSPSTDTVAVGSSVRLSIKLLSSTGTEISHKGVQVTWKSSDTTVAKVSENGSVTGLKSGVVKVTATVGTASGYSTVVVGTGTATATTTQTTTSSTTTTTSSSSTTTTTSTSTSSTTSTSSEPMPSTTNDVIYLDTRQAMQQATQLSNAWPAAKLGTASIGTQLMYEISGPFAFTTNMDGNGTHALRADWKNWNGVCADQAATLITYLPQPYPTHFIVSWKQQLGRTATGGGVGTVGSFQVTNPNCGTAGNGARKEFMALRNVPGMGSTDRMEFLWAGPAPAHPKITSDWLSLAFNMLPGVSFDPQAHVGEVITQTIELQAESATGAADGIVRLWINGVKVIENTHAAIGTEAFERFQFPTTFNSPMQDQSEYFWDFVAWTPVP